MRSINFKKFVFSLVIIILFTMAGFIFLMPWKSILEHKITYELESRGVKVSKLKIDELNHSQLVISELCFNDCESIRVEDIKVNFNLRNILKGRVNSIDVAHLRLMLKNKKKGFKTRENEAVDDGKSNNSGQSVFFDLLPQKINVRLIDLSLQNEDILIPLKLSLNLQKHDIEKIMQGQFNSEYFKIKNSPVALPPIELKSSIKISENEFFMSSELKSENQDLSAIVDFSVNIQDLSKNQLKISKVAVPFGKGFVKVDKMVCENNCTNLISVNLDFVSIDIKDLVAEDSGIKGSGKLNGNLELIIKPGFKTIINRGEFRSEGSGKISIPPSFIPGDDSSVKMTRDILSNFDYDTLNCDIMTDLSKNAKINLDIEGKNEDFNHGQKVKLKINLFGDIMSELNRSMMPTKSIVKFINLESENEK